MWQVSVIPGKIGETLGSLYKYAQDSLDSFLCVASGKARRKERDGDQNATDTKLYLEESVLERKLPEADLKALVDLPAGLDYNEWLASHTLALFEHVNLVYGTISEFCTPSGCPDMMGPTNRTYMWFDEKGKKTRVTAPQYIDYVMTFTQKNVSDELIFPTKYANEFPTTFESIARKILRLQFHVIAHLYAAHFREIALLGLHTHLNLTFAHLTALHRRFNLIDEKETDVLRDLELALRLTDDNNSTTNSNNNLNNVNNTNNNNSSGIITTTTTNNNNNKNFNNTIITTAITTSATTSNNCCNNTYNINNNNNNNISNNKNSNNYYNQQQQLQPNQTLCGENTDGDNIMGNTTTTTTMAIGCQTTANNNDNGTNNSLFGDNLIDGDASIPPICAQPEITANKLLNTNQIAPASTTQPTIDTIDAIQYHNVEQQQQQQQHQQQHHHQQQQQQKTLEHVHTRLIQCNAPNSGNLHYSSSSNSSNNTNNNIGNNSNFTSTYLIDGKRTASKY